MANNNDTQLNQNNNENTPSFEGTLSGLGSLKPRFEGTAYANYLNQIYNAGLNLQKQEKSLVRNETVQFNELLDQSKRLFSANPDATRSENIEMNEAINNSLGKFTQNTIDNRAIAQDNVQSWYQGIGDLISDESFAKISGEAYWNSLDGNRKDKYKQFNDSLAKLGDNDYWNVFFDENEIASVEQRKKDGETDANFFTDNWVESFTPSEYDKQDKYENRGFIMSTIFGGGKDYLGIGKVLNFVVWEPLEFMTVDLAKNSMEFVSSIFSGEGIDWIAGVEAGLAIGSWALMLTGTGEIAATAGESLEAMASKDIATSLTEEGLSTVGKDFIDQSTETFVKNLDDVMVESTFRGETVESSLGDLLSLQDEEVLFNEGMQGALNEVNGDLSKILNNKELSDEFIRIAEESYGKEVSTRLEKGIANYNKGIKDKLITSIDEEMRGMEGLSRYVDTDKLVKDGVISKQEKRILEKADRNVAKRAVASKPNATLTEDAAIKGDKAVEETLADKAAQSKGSTIEENIGDFTKQEKVAAGEKDLEKVNSLVDEMIDSSSKFNPSAARLRWNRFKENSFGSKKAAKKSEEIAQKMLQKQQGTLTLRGRGMFSSTAKWYSPKRAAQAAFLGNIDRTIVAVGETAHGELSALSSGIDFDSSQYWNDLWQTGDDPADLMSNNNYWSEKKVQSELEDIVNDTIEDDTPQNNDTTPFKFGGLKNINL